jgi:hypothetical protein
MRPKSMCIEQENYLVQCVNTIKSQNGYLNYQLLPMFKAKYLNTAFSYKNLRNIYDYMHSNKEVRYLFLKWHYLQTFLNKHVV